MQFLQGWKTEVNKCNFHSWMAQWVENLPAMQETQEMWGRSLDPEDPLEEKTATRSDGERSLVGYSPWDCRVGHNWPGAQMDGWPQDHIHWNHWMLRMLRETRIGYSPNNLYHQISDQTCANDIFLGLHSFHIVSSIFSMRMLDSVV